jgi:2-keto-3-deoxy-L-rhamnonate aldolase RhmA
MAMKPNRFRQMWEEGKAPVGHMLFEFNSRGVAKILDAAGVDFVVIDMEHSSFTLAEVADMVAWLKATPIAPFVRIPEVQYHLIARALDIGLLGVMAPNVQTAAQARAVVDAAKYPPLGKRGFHFGGASTDFLGGDVGEYVRYANENTTVICMIESPQGVENVEAIATTPGVDALWVGYGDLAQYMGIPGQFHDPGFLDALRQTVAAARKHGLAAIIQPGNAAQLKEWLAIGFNVISYGADFALYKEALTKAVAEIRQIMGA